MRGVEIEHGTVDHGTVEHGDEAVHPDEGGDETDLVAIERDLAAVEAALARLDAGTYWTDEVTGEPIPDTVLADDPTARRGS